MSNHGMQWLNKLDDMIDRAVVADRNDNIDDSTALGDDSDSEEDIGPRAFSRNVGACPLHADISKLRTKLHIPSLSPKRPKDETPPADEREFDSFVAEAPSSIGVPESDSPMSPTHLLHESIFAGSEGEEQIDRLPPPPLLSENRSSANQRTVPMTLELEQSERSTSETNAVSPPTATPIATLTPFQISGEVTQETHEASPRAIHEEEGLMSPSVSALALSQIEGPLPPIEQEPDHPDGGASSITPSTTEQSEDEAHNTRSRTETGDWSDRSIEISAANSVADDEIEDFQVDLPLPSWEDNDDTPFAPSMNCHGVVHVRLLRAQRLPCSIGSSIYAVVALPPWKGKIKTERTNAYRGPLTSGVCIRWDHLDEVECSSMVHAWNSDDTPIPTVTVELMFSPLQMMDFKIGSLKLTCETLMRSPGTWRKQWLPVDVAEKSSNEGGPVTVDDTTPLILIEAAFVPSAFDEEDRSITDDIDASESVQEDGKMPSIDTVSYVPDSPKRARSVSKESVMSRSTQFSLAAPKKFHHFRVHSFWTPATCSVCSSMLTGWKRGYRCEECNIDCCSNCQLQVDLQIPCGSGVAKAAVENSIQNMFDKDKLLAMVAPLEPPLESTKSIDELPTFSNNLIKTKSIPLQKKDAVVAEEGIATLRLNVVRACLFDKPLSPDSAPNEIFSENDTAMPLRRGDHYARISWTGSNESTRTRTIQNTGRPHFDSEEMKFSVPHYGMEYRIELLDANTDKPVGTTLLTTQGLLQWQRDLMIEESGLSAGVLQWRRGAKKRRTMLELRSGVKSGFGTDFFNSSKVKDTSAKSSAKTQPGEVSGWIEVDLCLEEDMERLYGPKPYVCPPAPPDNLNVDMFQVHIARIGALVKDVKGAINSYIYLVSWKDPALTSLSLILFVYLCFRFNAEYFGSLPVFFLILYMLRLASIRRNGDLKSRFTQKERDARIDAEKKIALKYMLHRPIGRVEVDVCRGKNIRSRDLGLTGSVGCRIYWDPLRFKDERSKKKIFSYDASTRKSHDIASTSYQYSQCPVWDEISESIESRRLKQLLPDHGSFFEEENERSRTSSGFGMSAVYFPVLQPILAVRKSDLNDGERALKGNFCLDSWSSSPGALVVQVRFRDVLNKLPGFDDILGEVCIPMSTLVENGEICGWFKVLEVGTKELALSKDKGDEEPPDASRPSDDSNTVDTIEAQTKMRSEQPQVYLQMRWHPPDSDTEITETDREASVVIAEEMARSAMAQESKLDLIGSSIGAFNTVRGLGGNVQFIQNILGTILDVVEKTRNAFNFSDPFKSSVLLFVLIVLWLFLAMVPTRALVLAGGLAQYAVTFVARYGPSSNSAATDKGMKAQPEAKDGDVVPVVTWLLNAFRALPTDEDLRKTYFWESRRFGEQESEILAARKRESRLIRLWKAEWYATVNVKVVKGTGGPSTSSGRRHFVWESAFAIVQGRRFLWWHSARDFDNGESPLGRIFLAGHAGLAGLSPLDLRELHENEIPLVVNIFGRGIEGQQKLTLLCGDSEVKEMLETSVLSASTKAD